MKRAKRLTRKDRQLVFGKGPSGSPPPPPPEWEEPSDEEWNELVELCGGDEDEAEAIVQADFDLHGPSGPLKPMVMNRSARRSLEAVSRSRARATR